MLFIPFIICLIIYFIVAFYGLKLQKLILSLLFFMIGYYISNLFFLNLVNNANLLTTLNVGIGLILASFSISLYKFSNFILAFLITFLIVYDLIDVIVFKYIFGITLGIIAGILSNKFFKYIIILLTSIYGAYNIVNILSSYFSYNNDIIKLIIFIIISILAINYQYKQNKNT